METDSRPAVPVKPAGPRHFRILRGDPNTVEAKADALVQRGWKPLWGSTEMMPVPAGLTGGGPVLARVAFQAMWHETGDWTEDMAQG